MATTPEVPLDAIIVRQKSFGGLCPVTDAVQSLASAGLEERGAVFTRREVVEFILDLVGYTPNRKLQNYRLLEPAFGQGDFLLPAIERLVTSWKRFGDASNPLELIPVIRAVELHTESFVATRKNVQSLLQRSQIPVKITKKISESWLRHSDFLLHDLDSEFDFVVGNPPYIRLERIPDALMREYRSRFRTVYDRADIYIPFIERSLTLLAPGGKLGFICADRWMKNRYGGPLREMVASRFHLECYVDMVDTAAFHDDVIAYPAITVISQAPPTATRVCAKPEISRPALSKLAKQLVGTGKSPSESASDVREVSGFACGRAPWLLSGCNQLELMRRLEIEFPSIEDAGCKVGIGVATGADKAFIGRFEELDVEDDRKLPLVTTRDIQTGSVVWEGLGIVNPFSASGRLVDLADYPRLARYFEHRKDLLARRHVAKKTPRNWFRTIDRIHADLTYRKKLLIPDIKGRANIVLETGKLYPHHNLYYITSDEWDIHALLAVLKSGIADLFVSMYSTRMRGNFLRFQAQYVRRIRLPIWKSVSRSLQAGLATAAKADDLEASIELTCDLYRLTREQRQLLIDQELAVA